MLPTLPADCWPEPRPRSSTSAEAPARAPEPGPAEQDARRTTGTPTWKPEGTFEDLLRALIGRPVTIIDPESFEEAPVGHRIRAAFYPAKLLGMSDDFIAVAAEFVHRDPAGRNGRRTETIHQYVPIGRVKRVSFLATGPLVHL